MLNGRSGADQGGVGERLRLALMTVNLSPAALGAAVGVDKSVVSRWLSGKVRPSGHNLTRIAIEIARRRPGFTTLAFDGSMRDFRRALGIAEANPVGNDPEAEMSALPFPFDVVGVARNETGRRGEEYLGHYDAFYWSFTRPGALARVPMMLRPARGLIEARYGARGFEFRGWALLLQNRLYVQLAERRHDAMLYMVTNAGQQPSARLISGIVLGPNDGHLMPSASAILLRRAGEITGRGDADDAMFESRADADPFVADDEVPDGIRAMLERLRPGGGGASQWLLRVPYVESDEPMAAQAGDEF